MSNWTGLKPAQLVPRKASNKAFFAVFCRFRCSEWKRGRFCSSGDVALVAMLALPNSRCSEEDTHEVLLVSVPSLIIGIPVPLSFVMNINRVGSQCHVLQNSISTFTAYEICCTGFHQYFHRVQSLCYCSQRSKRFRLVSEHRTTEERDFLFWPWEKSETTQKRWLRRLVVLNFAITFTV